MDYEGLGAKCRKHKTGLMISAVILLFSLALCLIPTEEPLTVMPMMKDKPPNEAAPAKVSGLTRASNQEEPRNPFSAEHEKRVKDIPRPGPIAVTPPSVREKAPNASGVTARNPSPQILKLKGIIVSEREKLAIISTGTEETIFAPGETVGDRKVTEIGEDFVLLTGPGGDLRLQLTD